MFSGIKLELPISIVTAIVSPNALPNESKIPAKIPDLTYGTITLLITSYFVAPRENAASLISAGTMLITSLPIDAEYGIIINANIREAVKIPTPTGIIPSFNSINLITGIKTIIPQKPYTTEGIPARSSTILFKKDETIPSLKYSPKNMEIEIEKGMDMIIANSDVNNVPVINGKDPKFRKTGSQSVLNKNPIPNSFIEGRELIKRVMKTEAIRTIMKTADR